MINVGELQGFGAVWIPAITHGHVCGPGVESQSGSLFGNECVVEVGEDRLQAFEGVGFGAFGFVVVGVFVAGAPDSWAPTRDADSEAPPDYFYTHHIWAAAPSEAVRTYSSSPRRHLVEDKVRAQQTGPPTEDRSSVAHMTQRTPLPVLASQIREEADSFALRIGNLMQEAIERNKAKYSMWVRTETPFTLEEAERLRKIALAYRELPSEVCRELPRPSSALSYVMEDEDPTPYLSPTARLSTLDLAAGCLLGGSPEELTDQVLADLRAWVGRSPVSP